MNRLAPSRSDTLTETLAMRLGNGARQCPASWEQPQRVRKVVGAWDCCGWSDGHSRAPVVLLALALALVLLTVCASSSSRSGATSGSQQARVKQRLEEVFHAAETKDLPRLDSYHWYGPHFTKFAGTGPRQDAATARQGAEVYAIA